MKVYNNIKKSIRKHLVETKKSKDSLNEKFRFATLPDLPDDDDSRTIKAIEKLINRTLKQLRVDAEDFGLGEMDELEEIESIVKIDVEDIKLSKPPVLYLTIYVNGDRSDYDTVLGVIKYDLRKFIPNIKIVEEIVNI